MDHHLQQKPLRLSLPYPDHCMQLMLVSLDSTFFFLCLLFLFRCPISVAFTSVVSHIIRQFSFQFCVGRERFEATAGDVFIMSKTPFKKGGAILANSKQTSVYFAVAEA